MRFILRLAISVQALTRRQQKASRGVGLISMHERLKILNGTLSIESQPKRGTTIHAFVPIKPGG